MCLYNINIFRFLFCFILFQTIIFSNNSSNIENWIGADDLYNININMATKNVKNKLGEPLFIESSIDDDIIIIKYIYSFRTKEYDKELLEKNDNNISNLSYVWGRTTNVQFIFNDDKLISWEENKLTLSQASQLSKNNGSLFNTFNLLLNIVVISLNAAVLMSL